jgi:hypothetical protein
VRELRARDYSVVEIARDNRDVADRSELDRIGSGIAGVTY